MEWDGLLDSLTAVVRDTFRESVFVIYKRTETGAIKTDLAAIFDYSPEALEAGGSLPTRSRIPVLDVRNADLGFEPLPDDEVTISGHGVFRVIDTLRDSSKNTKLHLRKI
ncbi:MAG: hypothetical protein EOS20_17375 [Mesorhizobium sp.]|uniref:head-tail joining protein n=1 Tax=Mesorhizobium sp. TaxID=1871066 RepID=UPI000FE970FE|nr:hypothetical protein [Mesorhizobium sp.]RWQ35844.1 MAG: hypothetical protein EOS20_17375 [Mesorhizobium sp.]